jgi:hypothetical protein
MASRGPQRSMEVLIPPQAGGQKKGLDTGLRRYDGQAFIGKQESMFFVVF